MWITVLAKVNLANALWANLLSITLRRMSGTSTGSIVSHEMVCRMEWGQSSLKASETRKGLLESSCQIMETSTMNMHCFLIRKGSFIKIAIMLKKMNKIWNSSPASSSIPPVPPPNSPMHAYNTCILVTIDTSRFWKHFKLMSYL